MAGTTTGDSVSSMAAPNRDATHSNPASNEPIEIQAATIESRPGPPLPISVAKQTWQWIKGTVQAAQAETELRPPRGRVGFFGPDTTVDLGFGPLNDPLVYATRDRYAMCADASLIELPLAVRPPNSQYVARLPYWPTYHDAAPEQRAMYLQWLYGGRQDPEAELGYVFIYFYGLERRVLVDKQDHLPVIEELLRLLRVYGHSRSFRGYATDLLWLATALLAESGGVTEELLQRVISATPRWTQQTHAYCLATCAHVGLSSLKADVAVQLAMPENGAPTSVVARRQPDKLHELFARRFEDRFPEGLKFRSTAPALRIGYGPASGTLLRERDALGWLAQKTWPNSQIERKQAREILALWNECIEHLRDFDRAAKGSTDPMLTAEMYETLPLELQTGEHPEFAAWNNLMQCFVDEAGWSVVSAGMLAEIKGITLCAALSKRHCESLLRTADALGLAIEPDMRRGGKNYRWDQKLVLFHAVKGEVSEIEWHAYQSAAALLSLGMQVAWADDETHDQELQSIARHLERHFLLAAPLQKRLEARVHYYRLGGVSEASVAKAMTKSLSVPQRQLVGEFLFEVALADEIVSDEEGRLLRKLYRNLGLSEDDLANLLAKHVPSPVAAEQADIAGVSVATDDDNESDDAIVAAPAIATMPHFDLERLRRIRADTLKVQELLHAALAGDNDESPYQETVVGTASSVAIPSPAASQMDGQAALQEVNGGQWNPLTPSGDVSGFDGLAERYHAFVEQLCQRADWPLSDLRETARQHGLMLAAALEAINEWSSARWGDWLVEENETHARVNQGLVEKS